MKRREIQAKQLMIFYWSENVIVLRLMALSTRILEVSNQLILAQQEGNESLINHLSLEQIELEKIKTRIGTCKFCTQ